ncbi:MAG: major outer membrane protein [Campylobacterota bacterium]|nr:major outer membrane protein [Campylobacterota bacterium]
MNKTIKLSLAVAMVAGMVSSANAKVSLDEAIKDVTLKGYVDYKLTKETKNDGEDREAFHDIDVRVQVDSKINDNYTMTLRVDEEEDEDDESDSADTEGDKNSSPLQPEIDQAYITYKDGGLKIKAGLQKVVAPRLHDSVNGDGIIVSNKLSDSMTVVGGYFYNQAKTDTDEIAGVALAGKAGMVKYGLTYATIMDSDEVDGNDGTAEDNGATVVDLTVDAKLSSALNIHGAYTTKSLDATGEEDQSLMKLVLGGKAGSVKYALGYAMAGEDGGNVSLDSDSDAAVNLQLSEVSSDGLTDDSAIYAMVGTNLTDTVSGKFEYAAASDADSSEYMFTLSNKVTKKLKLSASYNAWDIDNESDSQMILRAKYSF